jgi:hypothetical protein
MKRLQSFSDEEYFKTVVVAHSQEQAEKLAFWLTGAEMVWRGNFYKARTGNFLAYCRWFNNPANLPSTVYADAMLIYLENEAQFNDLSGYINSHRGIVNKIVISDSQDFSELANSVRGRWMQKPESSEQLQQEFLNFDNQFMTNAQNIFNELDQNKNGYLELNEVESLSTQLGDGFTGNDLERIKEFSDSCGERISFENFIIWWKLGKQNSPALQFMVKLDMFSSKLAKQGIKMFDGMKDQLSNVENNEENMSNHNLRLFGGNVLENPGFEFLYDLCLGQEKTEACINYLKQWTTNFNSANGIFLDFDFKFDETVQGSEVKRILDEKVTMVRSLLEALPEIKSLLDTFVIIETYGNQNSGKLTFRLKVDAEGLFKKHLNKIFYLLEHLFHGVSQHLHFDFRTKVSPKEVFSNNLNGFQTLKDFEADFNIKLMRQHLRVLASRTPKDFKEFLYILTAPSDVDVKIKLDMEKAAGPKLTPLLQIPLGMVKSFLQMVPLEMVFGDDLSTVRKLKEIQVALNGYFLFTRFKLHVEGILDE